MPAPLRSDVHNLFFVTNAGSVDLANHTAVSSVNTAVSVKSDDLEDLYPLNPTQDVVVGVHLPMTISAGIAVQAATVTNANTITIRTTNPSAGAIDPPAIAANAIKFLIARR
jgi:hypothetical protein